ncbi:MAG: D-alanyl-D-alanine carboxypeptidase/D-alanyl-D-alanine-endopeptidase [Balneolaceae bacterium]
MMRIIQFIIILFFIHTGISVTQSRAQLSDIIDSIINTGVASESFWALQVRDSSGTLLENYQGDKLIRPASNMKLLVSAAYLHELGSGFRFKTELYGIGQQIDNTWHGDLVIRGMGDPTINGEFHDDDPLFLFEKWLQVLKEKGITLINGNIIGNESYFDDIPYPRGWEWDDLSYYYGAETGALSFNSNVVELEVLADKEVGSTPDIQWFPFNTNYVEFINEQIITPANSRFDESYRRILGTNTILLRSKLPAGYYETEPLSITNPALYFTDTFAQYLEMGGIEINGQLIVDRQNHDWNSSEFKLFDQHLSGPLSEMIKWMNKESDNFFAEMLLKTLAAKKYNTEGSTELGLEIVKDFMNAAGLDSSKSIFRDASGMASATAIKASELNKLLVWMQQHHEWQAFFESMSVGGHDGTLKFRFGGSPLIGKFYGKSGFVTGVRTLSGYMRTKNDNKLVVTIATNNYRVNTSVIDRLHQRILEYLYSVY